MRGAFALAGSKYRYANPHGLPSLIGVREGGNITATWSTAMTLPPGASAPIELPTEPTIVLDHDQYLGFSEFIGSRAMLEAEGFTPPGGGWPDAYADVRWKSGVFRFGLRRRRPDGAKGSRRAFADVDWFCVRWELTGPPSWGQRDLDRKRRELAALTHQLSAEGQAEDSAQWKRYWASIADKPFQAFKIACGIVEKRRARPCKHVQGESHG